MGGMAELFTTGNTVEIVEKRRRVGNINTPLLKSNWPGEIEIIADM